MKHTAFLKGTAIAVAALGFMASSASAHVWNIGWESSGGGLTFYGVSYHTDATLSGAGGVDDFAANPAGFVINGTNINFDLGSATNFTGPTDNCYGAGGLTAGSCSADFNALNLDGAVHAIGYTNDYYGKYAFATLSAAQLATLGIGTGSNSVLLSTFSNNVHWAALSYDSATVPIDIIVKPPVSAVPLPAALPMLGSAFGLMGFAGYRRKRKAA